MRAKKKQLPPGSTKIINEDDPSKVHYRCPKLGWSVNMELRRCSFENRRDRLIQHYKKGKHKYNIPRNKDPLFPSDELTQNKIENSDNIQHIIMRQVALISSQLNISAKKACSLQMENFIRQLLKVGIQLKTDFSYNSLNTKDIFQMPNANILSDYIKQIAEETVKNVLLFFKEKFISLEMDSGTVNKVTVIHFVLTIPDSKVVKPFL